MNDVVSVAGLGLIISMGGFIVVSTLAGLLLAWLEPRVDHGEEH